MTSLESRLHAALSDAEQLRAQVEALRAELAAADHRSFEAGRAAELARLVLQEEVADERSCGDCGGDGKDSTGQPCICATDSDKIGTRAGEVAGLKLALWDAQRRLAESERVSHRDLGALAQAPFIDRVKR